MAVAALGLLGVAALVGSVFTTWWMAGSVRISLWRLAEAAWGFCPRSDACNRYATIFVDTGSSQIIFGMAAVLVLALLAFVLVAWLARAVASGRRCGRPSALAAALVCVAGAVVAAVNALYVYRYQDRPREGAAVLAVGVVLLVVAMARLWIRSRRSSHPAAI